MHALRVLLASGVFAGLPRTSLATTGCAPATANANVTTNETWTAACSPYNVTQSISVLSSATLTIEPGVTVRVGSNMTLTVGQGKLVANGTAGNPIVFTSSLASPTRKFLGSDSQGPLRVRVDKAHPTDPGFTGTPDPMHSVDHLHLERRENSMSGPWRTDEKVQYDWPF
jgi:hypothetical protein